MVLTLWLFHYVSQGPVMDACLLFPLLMATAPLFALMKESLVCHTACLSVKCWKEAALHYSRILILQVIQSFTAREMEVRNNNFFTYAKEKSEVFRANGSVLLLEIP